MDVHPRQRIRNAVAEALKFKTAADDRVYTSRTTPWRTKELPGIGVFTPDESADSEVQPEGSLRRMTLDVRAIIWVSEKLDDELDARSLEIEQAIREARDFGVPEIASVRFVEWSSGIDESQGRPLGVAVHSYEIQYASNL